MKKVTVILSLVLCTSLLLSFSACGSKSADKPSAETVSKAENTSATEKVQVKDKTVITPQQFKEIAERNGLNYKEIESEDDNSCTLYMAWYISDGGSVEANFMVYNTEEFAKEVAKGRINTYKEIEDYKDFEETSAANYFSCSYVYYGYYQDKTYLCGVGNTLLQIRYTPNVEMYSNMAEKFIKDLGY